MKPSIETLASTAAADIFDTTEFRNIIEDHLTWLINHPNNTSHPITAHQVDVYDFDWIGLLNSADIPADLHFVVIRMNGGISLTDVPHDLRSLRVPDLAIVKNLVTLSSSSKKVQ
jgi:hypothetical protein